MKVMGLILSLILGNQMITSFASWLECEDVNSEDCQVSQAASTFVQTCNKRRIVGCVNPATWLPLAAGAS